MKYLQPAADTVAVSLSALCTFHCLLLPLTLVLLPSLPLAWMQTEAFHIGMVMLALPFSFLALSVGCTKHRQFTIVALGLAGLGLLLAALMLEEQVGEVGEKLLTVAGAVLIAVAHLLNYRLCQRQSCCAH